MSDGPREDRGLYLPSGYYLDETSEPDFVILCDDDGREVAWLSAVGGRRGEIEKMAWEDFRGRR